MMRLLTLTRLFACLLFLITSATSLAQDQNRLDLDRIQRATVFVIQNEIINGESITRCIGSGTIIARSGLIATNAHHTAPNSECPGDTLIIALNVDPESPPIPTYRAEIAQIDEGLDLALLRITSELNGRLIEPDSLFLPFVELGDSDQVLLDDTITVVGYPSLFDRSVESVVGTVSGFLGEPSGGNRSWIKTNASIPGAMTGGGVYNEDGRLIGVPTTVPVTSLGTANCTIIEDTNNDGLVNRNDDCVPSGDFINALRPSNFVQPLLRSASLGISVQKLSEPPVEVTTDGLPEFEKLIVSPSVTNGQPATVVSALPTGTTSLYLFFDYHNMTSGTIYELRVSRDNTPDPRFSLAPVRWSGGENGTWYIGSSNVVWPPGRYTFELFINGRASGILQIEIGIPAQEAPTFRNITFCLETGENCVGPGNILPTGPIVRASFVHQNIAPGTSWIAIWYLDEVEIPGSRQTLQWGQAEQEAGTNVATTRLSSADNSPLPIGRYRLELYLEEDGAARLAARSDFVIAGTYDGAIPRIYTDVRFNSASNFQEAIEANNTTTFTNTVQDIYALFDWEQIAPGTLWRMRWAVDDVVFYDQITPWLNPSSGENYVTVLEGTNRIPDGTYRMELIINDIILVREDVQVGIGQLPIDQFAQATGVQLNGYIVDANTGEGIPGVSFLLISEDFSVEDFTWDAEQIYDLAVTDRNGRFQLNRLLQFDAPYSVIIAAEGYLQVDADGVLVDIESENPQEVVIPLTRE